MSRPSSLSFVVADVRGREYPKDDSQAVNYVELLRDLRQGLDQHAQNKGRSVEQGFELTIAAVSVLSLDPVTTR